MSDFTDTPTTLPAAITKDAGGLSPITTRWIALGAAVLSLVILFLLWPYQTWTAARRSSVLSDWAWVLTRENNSEWIFCLLVPPLAGYLVWLRRAELARMPLLGTWAGAAVIAVALVFYWMGYLVNTGYGGFIALHLMLAGLVLLIAGRRWFEVLFFPWLFLVFMFPLFPLEAALANPLQNLAASVSAKFLTLIGIPTLKEGSAIYSAPDLLAGLKHGDRFRLDVDIACSGIRSLYSLMMIGALYGILSLKRSVPRLVLFASTIPLAVLGNFVRLILLAIGSVWLGSETAVGRNIDGHQEMSLYHALAGYAVFAVGLGGMFAICSLLEGKHWKSLKKSIGGAKKKSASVEDFAGQSPRAVLVHSAAAVLLACAGVGICAKTNTSPHKAEPGVVAELPLSFDGYNGTPYDMTALERNILDEGVQVIRNQYLSPKGGVIMGSIVVSGFSKHALHEPEVCLPNQNWSIVERTELPVMTNDGRTITAALLRLYRDQRDETSGAIKRVRALNIYFYVGSNGTTSTGYYDHIRIGYIDAVLKGLNHRWSLASFFMPYSESEIGMEDPMMELTALGELKDFVAKLVPVFMPRVKQ